MRIHVEPDRLDGSPRLARALEGLAARGHAVSWRDRRSAESVTGADLVIGAASPVRVARSGWGVRADAMIVATDARALRSWGTLERFAWGSLWSLALITEADASELQAAMRGSHVHGIASDRVALWAPGDPPDKADVTHPDVEVLERASERALARARAGPRRAALFLDRDGTLVVERGYLSEPAGLELLPGVAQGLREAHHAGLALVVISNQAGVGRGRYPLERAFATMAALRRLLRAEGVELDAIHFCPHHPDAGCACRKPGTLLLERAADDLRLSLAASTMVGDRSLDVAAGQAAGGAGVLLRTGYGHEEERRLAAGGDVRPDADLRYARRGGALGGRPRGRAVRGGLNQRSGRRSRR